MEGLPSRLSVGHILPHHQTVPSSHFASIQPQPNDKLPPSYEEAQMAAQSAEIQQMGSFENEKYAIKRHPLFSLLSLLFEKCEQATQTGEGPSSASFDNDIRTFVHNQERDGKPFFSDDPELDSVMVKAIQVLRIHLLELEKVNELCKDFCHRYIACLKGKMQSENLLRSPPPAYAQNPTIISITGPQIQTVSQQSFPAQQQIQQQPPQVTFQAGNISSVVMPNPSGTLVNTYPGVPPGTTVVVPATQPPLTPTNIAPGQSMMQPISPMTPDSPDSSPTGKRSKRGVLPKSATNIMKTWLFQHLVHPYPTEDEKRSIAAQTNLTILQVNNWFINARRRILQPMLDASNPEGPKTKKPKQQNHPAQRMWPENLGINMSPNQYLVTQGGIPLVHTVQQPIQPGVQIQSIQPLQAVQHTIQQLIPQSTQQSIPQSSQGNPHSVHQGMHIQQSVQTLPHCIQMPVCTLVDSSVMTSSQTHMAQSEGMSVVVSSMLNPDHQVIGTLSSSSPTTTIHNGNLGNGEHNLVGSPHHLAVQGVEGDMSQGTIVGVDSLSMEGQSVGPGLVSR